MIIATYKLHYKLKIWSGSFAAGFNFSDDSVFKIQRGMLSI